MGHVQLLTHFFSSFTGAAKAAPVKTLTLPVLIAALAVPVSCSNDDGNANDGVRPKEEESPEAVQSHIANPLLSMADLGGMFVAIGAEAESDADLCIYIDEDTLGVGQLEWATQAFVPIKPAADQVPHIFQASTVVPEGTEEAAFDAVRAQIDGCTDQERQGITETYSDLDLAQYGDDSFAITLGASVGGVVSPLQTYIVYTRVRNSIMYLAVTDTTTAGIEKFAPLAVEKFQNSAE